MSMLSEQGKLGDDFHSYIEAMKAGEDSEDQILALREKYQYSQTISLDKQVVERLRLLCIEMITETKGILKPWVFKMNSDPTITAEFKLCNDETKGFIQK